ncbi:hypothetical protein ACJ41O_003967 [Fusarium nematophilum]
METCSPTKRRALAPLDANALASPKTLFKPGAGAASSPVKMAIEGRKRLLEMEGAAGSSPAGKKPCLGRDEPGRELRLRHVRQRRFLGDRRDGRRDDVYYGNDHHHPDDDLGAPSPRRHGFLIRTTTSQTDDIYAAASKRAEILRLRLSLANYKVRTGQTTVPLADLQRRPLPAPGSGPDSDSSAPRVVRVQSPSPRSSPPPPPPSSGRHRSSSDSQRTELMEPSEAGDVPGAD